MTSFRTKFKNQEYNHLAINRGYLGFKWKNFASYKAAEFKKFLCLNLFSLSRFEILLYFKKSHFCKLFVSFSKK